MPRRTAIGHVAYLQSDWKALLPLVGVGGALLFISAMLYFVNLVLTATVGRGPAPAMLAFAEATSGPENAPAFLDRWRPWIALAVALIVVAYAPTLLRLATMTPFASPGMRVW